MRLIQRKDAVLRNITATICLIISSWTFLPIDRDVAAESLDTPTEVAMSRTPGATMSIPRWKAFMHPENPQLLWLGMGTWGATSSHLVYSTDAGATWNLPNIFLTSTYTCDYHLSLAGDTHGNIYTVSPVGGDIEFARYNYPAQSSADREILEIVHSTGDNPRANIMIEPGNNRIWVFTRQGSIPSENVQYHYSDDGGDSWTSGTADPTGHANVRIGSMPYIEGRPALVVAYLNSPMGFRYYLWDGDSFESNPDAQIYSGNLQNDRAFTHNTIGRRYFHLIFGLADGLYHYWKDYNNGTGDWKHIKIDSSDYTLGIDWETTCSVRGDELFLFYRKQMGPDTTTGEIIYRKWSQITQTWSSSVLVSTHPQNTANRHPNTVNEVSTSCEYIPVFWYCDLGGTDKQVWFSRIILEPTSAPGDTPDHRPEQWGLKQNHPNPFNAQTRIDFSTPSRTRVKIEIYDLLGRHIRTLADEEFPRGEFAVSWDGKDKLGRAAASGVYFCRMDMGAHQETRKMVLLK